MGENEPSHSLIPCGISSMTIPKITAREQTAKIEYRIAAFFISSWFRCATSPIMHIISATATMRELSGFAAMLSDDVRAKNTASMILGLGKWSARRFAKYSDAAKVAKTGMSSRLNIE